MSIIGDLLLSFVDISVFTLEIFDPYKTYGKPLKEYKDWRKSHHSGRLISEGYITKDQQGSYALTPKARKKLAQLLADGLKINTNSKWDGLWRVVLFDIPETKRSQRNLFRYRLKELGFEMIQKSVFCHPYECMKEVVYISKIYDVAKYVTYFEVTSVVTGKDIFSIFKKKGFLK